MARAISEPYSSKHFSDEAFGGTSEAHRAALEYRREESLARGLTRNLMRVASEEGLSYLEVQLQGGQIMKCDLDDSALVETRVWCSWKSSKEAANYYAYWSGRGAESSVRLHRLLHPEWAKVDHINRDGLDNRRCNLRDGGGGVNERNARRRADNTSGATGVSYSAESRAWVVQWSENKRRRMKRFPGTKDDEAAKEWAIAFRRDVNRRTGNVNGL